MASDLFVVIGLGQFGETIARTLGKRRCEVLAIDISAPKIEKIKDEVARAVRADAREEATLRALGVAEASTAIVGMGEEDFEAAILTVAQLKALGVPRIIARATTKTHGKIFSLVGATRVVHPELNVGEQVALSLLGRGVHEYFSLETGHTLVELEPHKDWIGKTLAQLDLRAKHAVNVLALKRRIPYIDGHGAELLREETVDLPGPNDTIGAQDLLVIVGSSEAIERLTKR